MPSPTRICFVCTGNICRSPMGEAVLRQLAEEQGLADAVVVDSAGVGSWHLGHPGDPRALRTLAEHGYDASAHRARKITAEWFADHDLILALDYGHYNELRAMAPTASARAKVRMVREFDPGAAGDPDSILDVEDPYYRDDAAFTEVLHQLEAAAPGILKYLRASGR